MIDYSALAIPKPEPRKKVKARKQREYAKARKSCRAARYTQDGGCCTECGRPLVLDPRDARSEFEIANIHENRPRSLGGDPLDPRGQRTLCLRCHKKEHRQ